MFVEKKTPDPKTTKGLTLHPLSECDGPENLCLLRIRVDLPLLDDEELVFGLGGRRCWPWYSGWDPRLIVKTVPGNADIGNASVASNIKSNDQKVVCYNKVQVFFHLHCLGGRKEAKRKLVADDDSDAHSGLQMWKRASSKVPTWMPVASC